LKLIRKVQGLALALLAGCSSSSPHVVRFLDDVCIKAHHQYNYYTCCDVRVQVDDRYLTIPAGFDTDLASIPRPLWVFMSPAYSAFIAPSILHDYLYRDKTWLNRRQVDDIFYQALVDQGLGRWTAWKMWAAVRIFGGQFFIA
jgi:hypothetical protein